MSTGKLLIWSSTAMILAGALRALTALIPFTEGNIALELLYFAVDICLLFSLVGLYTVEHDVIGYTGFVGFLLATSGIGLIIGPDGAFQGISIYAVGAGIYSIGMIIFSMAAWHDGHLPRWIYALWVVAIGAGLAGYLIPSLSVLFIISGLMYGLSYAAAGIQLRRMVQHKTHYEFHPA